MYSGTTLTPFSGRVFGAHQKINRLARSTVQPLLPSGIHFPSIKAILHFEGVNGPDAIKRKSPARDEPWHYVAPFDQGDDRLIGLIEGHYGILVAALRRQDEVRAAFEAAWLAHALVDGLTPAHHFPYEEKLTELRGGQSIENRTTLKQKLLMPGDTYPEQVRNNWRMWGPRGLLTLHGFFEWGIALMIKPLSVKKMPLKKADVLELQEYGAIELFRRKAREVATLGMYEQYTKAGWTPQLASRVRTVLVPVVVSTVALVWYAAACEAAETDGGRA